MFWRARWLRVLRRRSLGCLPLLVRLDVGETSCE
jgi:hypothetical protein